MASVEQHQPKQKVSITVSTGDKTSAVDAVASLTASLADMNTDSTTVANTVDQPHAAKTIPTATTTKPPTQPHVTVKRPSSSTTIPTPRYAQPTAASSRRQAANARGESPSSNTVSKAKSGKPWGVEPTVPKSPNFAIAGGLGRRHSIAYSTRPRASLDSNKQQGKSNSRTHIQKFNRVMKRSSMNPNMHYNEPQQQQPRKKRHSTAATTVAKSPNFKCRGPVINHQSSSSSALSKFNTTFKPTPLPSYLIERDVLPDIKLNAKTVAAMEHRINPQPPKHLLRPENLPEPIQLEPTIPKPFELRGIEKHEQYKMFNEMKRKQEEEEDNVRREFHAQKFNEAILDGPTFMPARSDIPLTEPVDLLPFARERSERTRAFESKQKQRIQRMKRDKEIAEKMRTENAEAQAKEEYEKCKFKPRKAPRTTYEPDMKPLNSMKFSRSSTTNSSLSNASTTAATNSANSSAFTRRRHSHSVNSSSGSIRNKNMKTNRSSHVHENVKKENKMFNNTSSNKDDDTITTSSIEAQVSSKDNSNQAEKENESRNTWKTFCETSHLGTPVSQVDGNAANSRKAVAKPEDVLVKPLVSSTTTSETSQSQDSETRASRLINKVKQSLSPLLGSS